MAKRPVLTENIMRIFSHNTEMQRFLMDLVGVKSGLLWEIDGSETQLKTADEIDMQLKRIIQLLDPVDDQDAVTKKYADDNILWEVDGTETQLKTADEIDMQLKQIINLLDPSNDQDAATKKYVDDNVLWEIVSSIVQLKIANNVNIEEDKKLYFGR